MRFEQLEYLITISESRSLSEASKRLFMSQQSLGRAISNLERELGVELIERGRTGCHLTKDGLETLDIALEIIERRDYLKNKYGKRSETTGRLVILCCPSVHSTVLPIAIEDFSQRMPCVDVVVVAKDSQLIPHEHNALTASDDISVVSVINVPKANQSLIDSVEESALVFSPLIDDHWVACINKHHSLAGKSRLTLRELLKEQLVIEYPGYPHPGVDQITLDYYSKYGTPSVKKIVDNDDLLYSAIDKNEYIGFASFFYIDHASDFDRYKNITVKNFSPTINSSIGSLMRVSDLSDSRVQTFCNCLKRHISSNR